MYIKVRCSPIVIYIDACLHPVLCDHNNVMSCHDPTVSLPNSEGPPQQSSSGHKYPILLQLSGNIQNLVTTCSSHFFLGLISEICQKSLFTHFHFRETWVVKMPIFTLLTLLTLLRVLSILWDFINTPRSQKLSFYWDHILPPLKSYLKIWTRSTEYWRLLFTKWKSHRILLVSG